MTQKAIALLSKNENGFVLMVEGSKVDFAGHKNDALRQITDFLAFDKAVKVALDFAKQDGHTVVVVIPDHGNGGFNIGSKNSNGKYATIGLQDLFNNIADNEYIGYTTTGHTGEDVFVACYHPNDERPYGLSSNMQIHKYLCHQLGLENQLDSLTAEIFVPHQDVFKGMNYTIVPDTVKGATLTVKSKKKSMVIQSSTNFVIVGKEKIELPSVVVYQDINNTFYLPQELRKYLK